MSSSSTLRKSVVVLGALSGMGRYIADRFAQRGYEVGLAGRDTEELALLAADLHTRYEVPCYVLPFDATAFSEHPMFLQACKTVFNELPDGVIACFGVMANQEQAQQEFAVVQNMVETNFLGCVSILESFAAAFQQRGSGFIAALSSVAGDRGRKANYIYGATKAALSIYLQGLRNRLSASGVQVTTIKPGFVDTSMTFGMNLPKLLTLSPQTAASIIVNAIIKGKDVVYVPFFWRYIMWIINSIPECYFKKMNL